MDLTEDKDKSVEDTTTSRNTNTSAEHTQECGSTCISDCNDRDMALDNEIESGMISNNDGSQVENPDESSICGRSAIISNDHLEECCITVPESAYALPNRERIIGLIQAKGYIHGMMKPEDLHLIRERPSRRPVGPGAGDVTLNLTEFLSYAQRNNYDIVIPASRENRALNANLPRIGAGCGYMVLEQHFPRDFGATATAPYPVTLSDVSSRNSVLAPNIYHPGEDIQPPAVDFNAPPPYEMPLKLPTYEEVQREKALEGELVPPNLDISNAEANSPRTLSFLAIDADMGTNADPGTKLLGTDFMFAISFFLALVLNWIGFLLMMCFCHTVASRYGALSGFGLSLAKWTIIVKNSTEVPVHNAWLWWLITAFGLLICVRSLFQYINIKRGWRLMSAATQERLLFFY